MLIARIVILYARLLLIVQGLAILGIGWLGASMAGGLHASARAYGYFGAIAAAVAAVAVMGIVAGLLMRPGRMWAAIVVIVLEALWAVVSFGSAAAAAGGPLAGAYYVSGGLSVVALIGLSTPPARDHCGLAAEPAGLARERDRNPPVQEGRLRDD